ncbi:MAG: MarR family transcriptional regulator [Methanobacteriaceae archaeon]|nr:MarR family transcriptional regulator [Methanobacteriaceae archaeon]
MEKNNDSLKINSEDYINQVALIAQISFIARSEKKYLIQRLDVSNIYLSEIKLIMPILANDGLSQDDIVKTFGLNKSTVANSLRKLEEEGYITREVNPENRRKNQIFITPKGKELTEKIIKYNLEWEEQMGFKDLNPIFFKELHKLSSKCLNDLNSD